MDEGRSAVGIRRRPASSCLPSDTIVHVAAATAAAMTVDPHPTHALFEIDWVQINTTNPSRAPPALSIFQQRELDALREKERQEEVILQYSASPWSSST